jgi:hypothetical protein
MIVLRNLKHLCVRYTVLAVSLGLTASEVCAADVLVLGDSMMKAVARALKKECASRKLSVETHTSIGSGLARLDLLDWHDTVRGLVEEHKPATAFVMMGANDNQAMRTAGGVIRFGDAGWEIEYGRRAGKLMDILVDGGVTSVVWIGLPCMREKGLDADTRVISKIVSQQAAAREAVDFFSSYRMFSKKGAYSAYIIQSSGMPLDVRSSDGIHLNRKGAELLAGVVMKKTVDKK